MSERLVFASLPRTEIRQVRELILKVVGVCQKQRELVLLTDPCFHYSHVKYSGAPFPAKNLILAAWCCTRAKYSRNVNVTIILIYACYGPPQLRQCDGSLYPQALLIAVVVAAPQLHPQH